MKTLAEIYESHKNNNGGGDKGTTHSYIPLYEELLAPYRAGGNILEIGVFDGLSLALWSEYFINGKVVGIDIAMKHPNIGMDPRWTFIQADATNENIREKLPPNLLYDVIIDDGDHTTASQLKSYLFLKKFLKPNGIYVIEDINHIHVDQLQWFYFGFDRNKQIDIMDMRHIKGQVDDVVMVIR